MQRTACWIMSLALLGLALGCKDKKEGMAMEDNGSLAYEHPSGDYYGPDSTSSDGGYDQPADDGTATSGQPVSSERRYTVTTTHGGGGGYDSQPSGGAPAPAASSYGSGYGGSAQVATSRGGGTHVVARGDTLYKLARMYYNDQSKWRVIYEANRSQLSSPNQIRVGQQLVIP